MFNNNPTNYAEKMQRSQDYIQALEAERRKIQVFERELPLCLELVTQAIDGCRQQMCGTMTDYFNGQSECSEETSSEGPVLEEFMPMKRNCSTDEDEQQSPKAKKNCNIQCKEIKGCDKSSKKSDWLRSVQLCIQTPDPPIKEDSPRKVSMTEVKRNGCGAFLPFKKAKSCETAAPSSIGKPPSSATAPAAAASSTAETGGSGGGSKSEDKEGQSQRKARRCWSPELHRRFLQALQQLGGTHVATPKQIREMMKVDGLTNDEVKSHLQKYRLHSRRPTHSIHNSDNLQTPQLVVVGGIWMPPPEYAAMVATPTSGDASIPNGIYAPTPSLPPSLSLNKTQQSKQSHSDEQGSRSEARMHSHSPATSSSTHTTTASPAF